MPLGVKGVPTYHESAKKPLRTKEPCSTKNEDAFDAIFSYRNIWFSVSTADIAVCHGLQRIYMYIYQQVLSEAIVERIGLHNVMVGTFGHMP